MAQGALKAAMFSILFYCLENILGIKKYSKRDIFLKVAKDVALGAITGGIGTSKIGKIGGLLKMAVEKGYMTRKSASIVNRFFEVKFTTLNIILNKFFENTANGTWQGLFKKIKNNYS
jgi:hypothetical protein